MSYYSEAIIKHIVTNVAEGSKEEYKNFFNSALKKFDVKSPADLKGDKKKDFFNYIEKNYTDDAKESKLDKLRGVIKSITKEEVQRLNEADEFSADQMKFAKPIFNAAAKKGKFKIKKMYMSFQPQCEIIIYKYGKTDGSMTNIWGQTMTRKDAMTIKKAWEVSDMDIHIAEFKPKFHISTDSHYMTLWEAAKFAGVKYDRKEYDTLFRS